MTPEQSELTKGEVFSGDGRLVFQKQGWKVMIGEQTCKLPVSYLSGLSYCSV